MRTSSNRLVSIITGYNIAARFPLLPRYLSLYRILLYWLLILNLLISGVCAAQNIGYISVKSKPQAQVRILEFSHRTPIIRKELRAGKHKVHIYPDDYQPYKRQVLIKSGQELWLDAEFSKSSRLPKVVEKHIESYITVKWENRDKQSGADVYLDGLLIGKTPGFKTIAHPIAAHSGNVNGILLEVKRDGYQPYSERIPWSELRDEIEIFRSIYLVKISSYSPTSPSIDRQFVVDATTIAVFIALLVAISVLVTLIAVKLRQRVTILTHAAKKHNKSSVSRGTAFGKYIIQNELGRGGMSIVYKARNSALGHVVALKIPHSNMLKDGAFVQRFLREAEIDSKLHHPNIVKIIDHGEINGVPYLATEFINGGDLKEIIEQESPLSVEQASWIIIQVCQALDYAHSKQVFHRDIKPDNIMMSDTGIVKVMDFGIALAKSLSRLSVDGIRWLSAYYMFPEKEVTPASDLYSLGIVYYEMLTGRVPFSDGDLRELMKQHEQREPADPKVYNPLIPADVKAIIMKLLRKNPADRFQEASEVINVLNRFAR